MARTTTRSSTAKAPKAPAKTIAKSRVTPKKTKAVPAPKKSVTPKVTTSAKTLSQRQKKADKDSAKQLDLCLLLDCTSSMSSWIERSKNTLKQIIDHVKSENPGLTVRVSFVGYRDIKDHKRFEISPFTGDIDATKAFIGKISASGGADMPEDVQGGFNKALI